jgi:hypothetical protein
MDTIQATLSKEDIMATQVHSDCSPIDLAPRHLHSLPPMLRTHSALRDQIARVVVAAADWIVVAAVVLIGWTWLLTLQYQSFARPFH